VAIVYIGYGSNLRGRLQWVEMGREMLEDVLGPARRSPIYESNPIGEGLNYWFLNGVWMFQTNRSPREILMLLLAAEVQCGRAAAQSKFLLASNGSKQVYQDRTLDLDLLLYDDLVLEEDDLIIPHPRMHLRKFVLKPFAELAPFVVHPLLKRTISQILQDGVFEGQEVRSYP